MDVQDAGPSSDDSTCNTGSTHCIIHHTQCEFSKDNEDNNLEESNWSTENEIGSSGTESEYLLNTDDISIDERLLRKHKCSWQKTKPPIPNMDFVDDQFSLPLEDFKNFSPHDIFLQFWSNII